MPLRILPAGNNSARERGKPVASLVFFGAWAEQRRAARRAPFMRIFPFGRGQIVCGSCTSQRGNHASRAGRACAGRETSKTRRNAEKPGKTRKNQRWLAGKKFFRVARLPGACARVRTGLDRPERSEEPFGSFRSPAATDVVAFCTSFRSFFFFFLFFLFVAPQLV